MLSWILSDNDLIFLVETWEHDESRVLLCYSTTPHLLIVVINITLINGDPLKMHPKNKLSI